MVQTNLIKAFIQKILPCYRTRIHTLILVLTSLGLKNSVERPRVTDMFCAGLSTHKLYQLQDTLEHLWSPSASPSFTVSFWMVLSFVKKFNA